MASQSRRITVPFVIPGQAGLGAGYYEFNTVSRIWSWRGLSAPDFAA